MVSLVVGLVLFLVWLPNGIRTALWAALQAQWALVGMTLFFAMITVSLTWSAGQCLDTWIFQLFNFHGDHSRWLDRFMWLATQLGNMVVALVVACLFMLLNNRNLAAVIILGTLTLWLLVESIKALTNRARPFLDLEGTRVLGRQEPGRSFPSGHTAQTFFLATLISHQFKLGAVAIIALYGVAMLVGFTRIYVGVHYPRDVLGGAVLGSAWGILAALVGVYLLGLRS
jgi:membrane-associated phospholipid phosphatase